MNRTCKQSTRSSAIPKWSPCLRWDSWWYHSWAFWTAISLAALSPGSLSSPSPLFAHFRTVVWMGMIGPSARWCSCTYYAVSHSAVTCKRYSYQYCTYFVELIDYAATRVCAAKELAWNESFIVWVIKSTSWVLFIYSHWPLISFHREAQEERLCPFPSTLPQAPFPSSPATAHSGWLCSFRSRWLHWLSRWPSRKLWDRNWCCQEILTVAKSLCVRLLADLPCWIARACSRDTVFTKYN